MKKSLTGNDASILALFAQDALGICPERERKELLEKLSCNDARDIGRAIIAHDMNNPAAKVFVEWADSLSLHDR